LITSNKTAPDLTRGLLLGETAGRDLPYQYHPPRLHKNFTLQPIKVDACGYHLPKFISAIPDYRENLLLLLPHQCPHPLDQEVVDFHGDMASLGEGQARDTCESCTNFQIWKQLNNSFEGQGGVKK